MDKRLKKRFKREHRKKSGRSFSQPSDGDIRLVYRPRTEEERQRVLQRSQEIVGRPFVRLPGSPDQESVIFRCLDGTPISVANIEMVMNDAWTVDYCYGQGMYEKHNGVGAAASRTLEVLVEARKLYGCHESDLHGRV